MNSALNLLKQKVRPARRYLRHALREGGVCPHTNIYHCTTQKTASQWIVGIFDSLHSRTDLDTYACDDTPETMSGYHFTKPFPRWSFVTNLYIPFETYRAIPKRGSYRTFYILRDPRDIVVSWYFSTLYSHPLIGDIAFRRAELSRRSQQEGLIYGITHLDEYGVFSAQRGWIDQSDDSNVKIFRYEELAGNEQQFLRALLQHCNISVTQEEIQSLVKAKGFEAAAGRKRGDENTKQHLRKGIAGDWHNYFDEACLETFARVTGDLVPRLGYK